MMPQQGIPQPCGFDGGKDRVSSLNLRVVLPGLVPPGSADRPHLFGKIKMVNRPRTKSGKKSNARITVLRAFICFFEQSKLSATHARAAFSALYNGGNILVKDWVREAVPSVSPQTISNWQKEVRQGRTLISNYGHRKGTGIIESNKSLTDFCIAQVKKQPTLKATVLKGLIKNHLEQNISLRTVQYWLSRWKNPTND